jgi:secreted trypsin-like serine protease
MSEMSLWASRALPACAVGVAVALSAAPAMAQSGDPAGRSANPDRARVEALLATVPRPAQSDLNQPLVVDGKRARPGEWPFAVALVSKGDPDNYAAQFCGGSLIDSDHVLTAAHCVDHTNPGLIQVLVGTHSLVSGGRRVDVTRITMHPDYALTPFLQADVAVLRLGEGVTDITPVAYAASQAADNAVSPDNTKTTVMGWGALEWNKDGPQVMHEAKLRRNTVAECNALSFYAGRLTDNNVCAGDLQAPGKSACYGDSGGPLIGKDDKGTPVQIGVVSGGPGVCGEVPGYFARVGSYAPWITAQLTAP